jgi:hypothetical protein
LPHRQHPHRCHSDVSEQAAISGPWNVTPRCRVDPQHVYLCCAGLVRASHHTSAAHTCRAERAAALQDPRTLASVCSRRPSAAAGAGPLCPASLHLHAVAHNGAHPDLQQPGTDHSVVLCPTACSCYGCNCNLRVCLLAGSENRCANVALPLFVQGVVASEHCACNRRGKPKVAPAVLVAFQQVTHPQTVKKLSLQTLVNVSCKRHGINMLDVPCRDAFCTATGGPCSRRSCMSSCRCRTCSSAPATRCTAMTWRSGALLMPAPKCSKVPEGLYHIHMAQALCAWVSACRVTRQHRRSGIVLDACV